MPAAKPTTTTIRIKVPNDVVDIIDKIAAQKLLSRTSWMRHAISRAVRFELWESRLNKREGE